MKGIFNLSNAELMVMEKLWEQENGIKQSQLLALFEADGKTWKRQTLNTFLSRLEVKGLVRRDNKIVETVYSRDEYCYTQVKAAINCLYDGQLIDFMIAFAQNSKFTEMNLKELIHILENS